MESESWKLTDFNIEGHIILDQKFGLIKIMRSEDGTLILVGDANYGIIDQTKPTPANFLNTSSLLGFVLDIGIQKEKWLTHGNGFYFGMELVPSQSKKKVSQKDFDGEIFQKIGLFIQNNYQSNDKPKEMEAIRTQLLLDTYNNARLLFPNFYAESYLNLMRIIDALSGAQGSYDFSVFVATASSALNEEIYKKLNAIEGYKSRIEIAIGIFDSCFKKATEKNWSCKSMMEKIDIAGKVVFGCFFSAYQYRNKFVHNGFPFPNTVKDAWGLEEDSGTAYLSPGLGISWSRMNRQDGLKDGDLIDIHEVVAEDEVADFRDKYFQLLPTWHFLKVITRSAFLNKIVPSITNVDLV